MMVDSNPNELRADAPEADGFARPTGTPQDIADLVSSLSHQQQAEVMYELAFFAALAAEETGHPALNEFLAELEELASVYTDPERRKALGRTIQEARAQPLSARLAPHSA